MLMKKTSLALRLALITQQTPLPLFAILESDVCSLESDVSLLESRAEF